MPHTIFSSIIDFQDIVTTLLYLFIYLFIYLFPSLQELIALIYIFVLRIAYVAQTAQLSQDLSE